MVYYAQAVFSPSTGFTNQMLKLSYLSAVGFSGVEAGDFLHSQLSADVKGLAAGEATFACYCEPKGRVLALLLVQRLDTDYQVILSAELAAAVTARLKIYRLRARVDIEIMNDQAVFGLAQEEPAPARAITVPGGRPRLVLAAPDAAADDDDALREAWKFADLESGICWLGETTSGEFLPQMLGFEELGAVNYRKGCYPGQEIVARTHYLGKVKRHPRLLDCRLAGAPRPMDKLNILTDGQTHEAVVADYASGAGGITRILTVTRMEPETRAERIEYAGETVAVIQPG
jgi:folate-binding protein YgfZ